MKFNDLVNNRYSIRSYLPTKVPREQIDQMLDAARLAPTWANMQGMHYIIVEEEKLVKSIWKAVGQRKKFLEALIFIVGVISEDDSGENGNGMKYYSIDFGICFEHLILAATAEGLATCWIGWFNEKKIKNLLNIPEKYRVLGLTPLGYAIKEKGDVKDRKQLSEIIHYNKF